MGDALTYIKNVYYPGQADKDIRADLPVAVVNANSMWLRVELGGSSALFTGDIMKKKSDREDEPMDRMIAHYGAETRVRISSSTRITASRATPPPSPSASCYSRRAAWSC